MAFGLYRSLVCVPAYLRLTGQAAAWLMDDIRQGMGFGSDFVFRFSLNLSDFLSREKLKQKWQDWYFINSITDDRRMVTIS